MCGLLVLAGIVAFEVVGPQVVAGPRVTGDVDETAVRAYYSHAALAPFALGVFVAAMLFIAFAGALRRTVTGDTIAAYFAGLGFAFAVAEAALLVAKSALHVALVELATGGGEVMPLFRFWDLLYNSGLYAVEAALLLAFGLAWLAPGPTPRWLGVLSLVAAALQGVNMLSLFLGFPDLWTLPGNLAFMAWFVGASLALWKQGGPPPAPSPR